MLLTHPADAEGTGALPWQESFTARLEALALLQTLNAELLSHNSATLTLDRWCAAHRLASPARIVADCVSARGPEHDRQRGLIIPIQRNQWPGGVPLMPMGVILGSAFTATERAASTASSWTPSSRSGPKKRPNDVPSARRETPRNHSKNESFGPSSGGTQRWSQTSTGFFAYALFYGVSGEKWDGGRESHSLRHPLTC